MITTIFIMWCVIGAIYAFSVGNKMVKSDLKASDFSIGECIIIIIAFGPVIWIVCFIHHIFETLKKGL